MLTLCSPFTPMLFMGEEWGASTPWQFFTSHPEPELGAATAQGRIDEFARMGWDPDAVPDPQDPATFLRSKLDWSERDRPAHRELLELYRELIALRHREPEFADPRFDSLTADWDDTLGWFVLRQAGLEILVNFGNKTWSSPGAAECCSRPRRLSADDAHGVHLPPDSAAVVRRSSADRSNE